MFTRKRRVGSAGIYKTETDWGAIGALAFWGGVILLVVASCAG